MTMKHTLYLVFLCFLISCSSTESTTAQVKDVNPKTATEENKLLAKAGEKKTADSYLELARFYITKKNKDEAYKAFEKALKLDSSRTDIRFEYGDYAYNNDSRKLGLRNFRDVLQSNDANQYLNPIAAYLFGYKITQLTTSDANNSFPAISPDGKTVYFQTDINGNWDIASIPLTGGEMQMVHSESYNEEHPVIANDGKNLIYTSDEFDNRTVTTSQKWREIVTYNFKSKLGERLTRNYCDDYYPRFSHFSNEVIFVSERSDTRNVSYGERNTNLFVMNFDGSFQIPVTKGNFFVNSGTYIENGDFAIFSAKRDGNKYGLYKVNNLNKEIIPFLNLDFNAISVDASSDNKRIIFSGDKAGNLDLYMTDRYGNKLERISSADGNQDQAVFSLDGKTIVYHSNETGKYQIFIVDLESRAQQPTVDNLLSKINNEL